MEYDRPLFYHVMEYAAASERDTVDMVSGNPDWGPPDALREGLIEYASGDPGQFQYPPSEGLSPLREEIADRRGVEKERVIVTNGAGEANHLSMATGLEHHSGSEVLLADPVYPYYAGRSQLLGATPTFVPAERTGQLDPDRVREAASEETALIVVNTPNNPTGAVYDPDVMTDLIAIGEANDALVVSDEVYDHFDYTGTFESALSIDSEHRVVTNSFSKSLGVTGLRVGYAVLPERLVEAVRTRHMLTNVAGSRPAQRAVYQALRDTDRSYYERNRERLRDRIETFTEALDAIGAEYARPDGGFYVLARFDSVPGTLENTKRLIDEAGVAGMPGEAFGRTRADWFRFALLTQRVDDAATRLEAFVSDKQL
ncbi:pyridoxal phosphate-dependent aminotransferase [Halocatena salina]|uniref:Aminotransferase n=1 Tax=Halocatena salina TaxID=2934340 RepID=A0A8T9ZZW4_9EURY|nr:pyridoxal phosphate-dependent aminotransferase [Halocatena salina]UPM42370.1 pyridoxal phosphate-dependent aminotransferase [Halocatena salina]